MLALDVDDTLYARTVDIRLELHADSEEGRVNRVRSIRCGTHVPMLNFHFAPVKITALPSPAQVQPLLTPERAEFRLCAPSEDRTEPST